MIEHFSNIFLADKIFMIVNYTSFSFGVRAKIMFKKQEILDEIEDKMHSLYPLTQETNRIEEISDRTKRIFKHISYFKLSDVCREMIANMYDSVAETTKDIRNILSGYYEYRSNAIKLNNNLNYSPSDLALFAEAFLINFIEIKIKAHKIYCRYGIPTYAKNDQPLDEMEKLFRNLLISNYGNMRRRARDIVSLFKYLGITGFDRSDALGLMYLSTDYNFNYGTFEKLREEMTPLIDNEFSDVFYKDLPEDEDDEIKLVTKVENYHKDVLCDNIKNTAFFGVNFFNGIDTTLEKVAHIFDIVDDEFIKENVNSGFNSFRISPFKIAKLMVDDHKLTKIFKENGESRLVLLYNDKPYLLFESCNDSNLHGISINVFDDGASYTTLEIENFDNEDQYDLTLKKGEPT